VVGSQLLEEREDQGVPWTSRRAILGHGGGALLTAAAHAAPDFGISFECFASAADHLRDQNRMAAARCDYATTAIAEDPRLPCLLLGNQGRGGGREMFAKRCDEVVLYRVEIKERLSTDFPIRAPAPRISRHAPHSNLVA